MYFTKEIFTLNFPKFLLLQNLTNLQNNKTIFKLNCKVAFLATRPSFYFHRKHSTFYYHKNYNILVAINKHLISDMYHR